MRAPMDPVSHSLWKRHAQSNGGLTVRELPTKANHHNTTVSLSSIIPNDCSCSSRDLPGPLRFRVIPYYGGTLADKLSITIERSSATPCHAFGVEKEEVHHSSLERPKAILVDENVSLHERL